MNKLFLMFKWKGKKPRRTNKILKEKNKVGRLTLPDFKAYHKAIIITTGGTGKRAHK